jgi:hypothetical protein
MWNYRCYDDGGQPNLWQRWHDSNPDAHGSHESVFAGLETMVNWKKPWTRFFDKKNRIIEARLSADLEWRIWGFHSGAQREFVVLEIGFHKDGVWTPPGIRKTLVSRKTEVERNPAKAPPCDRPKRT